MRIALVNNFFPPRASGSAHLTEELAARLVRAGHDVLVLTAAWRGAPADEARDGYRVRRLPSATLPKLKFAFNFDVVFTASPRNLGRVFRILDEFAPDVLHQHGQFFDLTWMSSLWARRRRVPTVLSVHTRLEHPNRLYGAVMWLADVTVVRACMALSRPTVVVMDRLMHAYIRSRYRIPDDRMAPIPVGVDPRRFDGGDGARVREEHGLGDRPVILSVGHVIPIRNRLTLVRAMPCVLERLPEAVLVVVGAVYDDRFLAVADELGLAEHVVLTDAVPKDDVPAYVAAADVEVHDLEGIGLGMASLEVMAAGVPTIAAVRPDNFLDVELESGRNVLLVPPEDPVALADTIVEVLGDPELARGVGAGQQALIRKHFAFDVVAARHMDLYERLAEGRGQAG